MKLSNDTDLFKAWQTIDRLKPGEIYKLAKIPQHRRNIFIRCIKQRIDTLNDCEFNPAYTKIKKLSDFYTFTYKIS
jgi:hypothetical protein